MKTELSYRNKSEGNTCIPAEMLWDYLDGKLSAKQQHRVEVHLLDCPMCTDALEGFKLSGNRAKVTQLNAGMVKEITYRSNWYLPAAAASVVLVATLGLLWWAMGTQSSDVENIAQQTAAPKPQETISAATPEERAPGSPEPELNRPASDGIVPQYSSNSNGYAARSNTFNNQEAEKTTVYLDSTLNSNYAFSVADEEVSKDEDRSIKETRTDVAPTVSGNSAGAGSGPAPAPAAPATTKPLPGDRDVVIGRSSKKKQAPSAAEATPKKASLAEGMQYYNASNFTEAIKVFKDVLDDDATNQEARYYLGMSYKGIGEKVKALDELTKVGSTCLYYDDALWNRSLLLIEAGRKTEAKPLLQKLVDGKGKYADKAGEKLLGL